MCYENEKTKIDYKRLTQINTYVCVVIDVNGKSAYLGNIISIFNVCKQKIGSQIDISTLVSTLKIFTTISTYLTYTIH